MTPKPEAKSAQRPPLRNHLDTLPNELLEMILDQAVLATVAAAPDFASAYREIFRRNFQRRGVIGKEPLFSNSTTIVPHEEAGANAFDKLRAIKETEGLGHVWAARHEKALTGVGEDLESHRRAALEWERFIAGPVGSGGT